MTFQYVLRLLPLLFSALGLFSVARAADDLVIGTTTFSFFRSDIALELTVKNVKLGEAASVNATVLSSPARLVIDISPSLTSLNGRYRLTDSVCQTLRLGTDAIRTRIVVDCSDLPRGQFRTERKSGEIKVRFSYSTPPASATTTTTSTTVTTTTLPTIADRISFQKLSFEQGAVLLRFSGRTDFSLLKGAFGTILTFPGAILGGRHLAFEHFPPGNVHGVLAIVPAQDKAGVNIKLLTNAGYELKAEWQGETLVVTPIRQ